VRGAFSSRKVGKRMLARPKGGARHFTNGRIVNIASMANLRVLLKLAFVHEAAVVR
jgi:NAD(P)-dependent dehydrogenase (short-subunit alcohol dehydrogenase family)